MSDQLQSGQQEYAVVDVETTGLRSTDRVIEIGIVVLDRDLEVIDEYETLIDPMRDVGETSIHGISPKMLAGAPSFEEVSAAIGVRLNSRYLVGHNLYGFDQRMLKREYSRLHAELEPGRGFCTLRA